MKKIQTEKLWTFPFIMITLAFFFSSASQQMINSSFSLFVDHLGGPASYSGLTAGAFAVSAIVSRALGGRIADTVGRRVVALYGGIIYAASVLGFAFFQSFWVLMILRITQGFGYAALNTSESVVASDVVPEKRMGEGLGYFGMGMPLASAIGPQAVMLLLGGGTFERLYTIVTLLILASLTCMMVCRYQEPERVAVSGGVKEFLRGTIEKKALPAAIVAFFTYSAISMVFTFLALYATRRGFDNYGMFFTVAAVTMLAAKLFTGRICDRYGTLAMLVPCSILGIVMFCLLAVTERYGVFLFCAALYGVYLGATIPMLNTVAVQEAPQDRHGAAVGTFFILIDMGVGVGGVVWGVIIDYMGFTAAMFVAAATAAVALVLGVIFFRKKRSSANG